MGRVDGKSALVTGGARGIGAAIATALVREGARVTITDLLEAEGRATAQRLGAACAFRRQDVTVEAEWPATIAAVVQAQGGLHVLVNNAGVVVRGAPVDIEQVRLEDLRKTFAVNVEGVLLGCKYAIPAMRQSGGGSIVNQSSIAALLPTYQLIHYGMSKAAVRQLTLSVAARCARGHYNIRCNSVHPGQIMTDMMEGLLEDGAAAMGGRREDALRAREKRIPAGQLGTPEDIANAVLFLASDESRYITGHALVVDGGFMMNA